MAFNIKTNQPMFQPSLVEGANPFASLGKTMSELDGLIEGRRADEWGKTQDFSTIEGLQAATKSATTKQQQDLLGKRVEPLANIMALQAQQGKMDKMKAEAAGLPAKKAYEEEKRKLTLDKLGSETIKNKAEAAEATGFKLSDKQAENVNKLVNTSNEAKQSSNKWNSLAETATTLKPDSGFLGMGKETLKGWLGTEDDISLFKKDWQASVNSEAMKLLPPGTASDNDVKMVLQGFPGANANPEQLASFARGMAKIQDHNSKYNDLQSQWLSQNETLTRSNRGIEINGIKIPKGTSFNDFMKESFADKQKEKTIVSKSTGRDGKTYVKYNDGTHGVL